MRRSRFTEQQIVAALRQAESGTPVVDVCWKLGISEQAICRWKRKLAGMGWPSHCRAMVEGSMDWNGIGSPDGRF